MRAADVVREYLSIAADLDRLLPGFLDSYGPRPARGMSPPELVRAAGLLVRVLPDVVEPLRADFLRGQLIACEWAARRLTGQAVPFAVEVRAAFGVRIGMGFEDGYRAAHRELDALLPGPGPLAERIAAHRVQEEIPRDRLPDAIRVLTAALRERTLAYVEMPEGERVAHRIVDDAPWSALHHYAGGFSSVVTFNAGARPRASRLVRLVAHEIYPGHHTERCRKEAGLVHRHWDEHRAVLANTPQSLVGEGAAELGLDAVVGPGWGKWAEDLLADVGVRFDGELAERVDSATSALIPVRQDAALLLHERRKPDEEVLAFLRRWLFVGEHRARAVLRFLADPLWRAYTTTYVEGPDLVRRWLAAGPPEERLRRLLDEPLTPWALDAGAVQIRAAR